MLAQRKKGEKRMTFLDSTTQKMLTLFLLALIALAGIGVYQQQKILDTFEQCDSNSIMKPKAHITNGTFYFQCTATKKAIEEWQSN